MIERGHLTERRKLNIVVVNDEERCCLLINIVCRAGDNRIKEEGEKNIYDGSK